MEALDFFWLCLRLALLLAGLLAPGAALFRALRLPCSIGGYFAGSALILYASALALNACAIPLALTTFATAIASVTLVALLIARRRGDTTLSDADGECGFLKPFTSLGALAPFILLYWAMIGFLLFREPLAGPDIQFRWAFLPEQWLRHGNLDFYPPVSPTDFLSYFWVESIPPGIASLHAWAFACGGSFVPAWTIPVTALQFLALHDLAWRAGSAAGGEAAARPAAVLIAACPLLNWACRLGQETGLATIAVLGLVFTLLRWRATNRPAWACAAGIFAILGAMTREYGLVFPALAIIALGAGRASRTSWLAFAVTAMPLAAAWPLRCALRTGNPFYSLDVGGLLPVNPVFLAWISDHGALFGTALTTADGWLVVAHWLALGAAPALAGWIALLVVSRKQGPALLAAMAVVVFLGLWLLSVPYTVGGLFYSLRVASPALALGAVAAGFMFARGSHHGIRTGLLGIFLLVTLPITLLLPRNYASTPLSDWPAPWRQAPPVSPGGAEPIIPALLAECGLDTIVLTDSPGYQTLLASHHLYAIPFWSPQAAWLFDPKTTPADAARRWRESGLRLVLLSKFAPAIDFVNRRARWGAAPFRMRVVAETSGFMLLSIEAPQSRENR